MTSCKIKISLLWLILFCHYYGYAQLSIKAGDLTCTISSKGYVTGLLNGRTGLNYLATDTIAPLLTIVKNQTHHLPAAIKFDKNTLRCSFQNTSAIVTLKYTEHEKYLSLEIIKAAPENEVDAIIWGPFPTTISKTIGEVIGVVQNDTIAMGLQVLNVKTLGGDFPNSEGSTSLRGMAARSQPWGSTLQAYSINRNRNRMVNAWDGQFENMPVAAIKGETVVGSKIALFSCAVSETGQLIERMEIAELLPHPTIKGSWFKNSALYGKSYLISSFNESEVDEMINYTKRAGLISLYHEGPFKSWGHYVLNEKDFPNGKQGLKIAVDKAHAAKLFFGVHTLTNFINTNDAYVSPVPDERLSVTGSSILQDDLDAQQREIIVASPEYFNNEKSNSLHTVKIGKELIRYKSVTGQAPFTLIDCQRGAFGTMAAAHKKGMPVAKLLDHPYQVFFPNLSLQREIAGNLVSLFNETGVDHFDFDGLEGCFAAGEGDYGIELFAKDVYDGLRHDFIAGTSLSKTFFWHIGSYYNWGEPWYGGFKESMQQYRIDNQALFARNKMPHMLGWYLLSETTTMPDMEWMLARAAAYDAGFAMVARPKALRANPNTPQLLDAIKEWETARNAKAFSAAQQESLKNTKKAFHLQKMTAGEWNLYEYNLSAEFTHEYFERQPGEPNSSKFNYIQDDKKQPLQFRLYLNGSKGGIDHLQLQIDNYTTIQIPVPLVGGESIVCADGRNMEIYSKSGAKKGIYALGQQLPEMNPGAHNIIFSCDFSEGEKPKIDIQFKTLVKMETIKGSQ
jgi:hypothetical protein